MKQMVLFLHDDVLNVIYNKKCINIKLENVIFKGNIINREKFIEEFLKLMKKEKIRSKLFGDNIYIVRNSYFNNRDLFFLENIFMELGFLKVIYIDIKELLPDMDALFIEVNKNYMVVNFPEGVYVDLDVFKDVPRVLSLLKDKISGDVVLFGSNKNIPDIKFKEIQIYYLEDYTNYITNCLLKVKKYGA